MSNFASKPERYGSRYDSIFESSRQSPIPDQAPGKLGRYQTMRMKLIYIFALAMLMPLSAAAQSKAEASMYGRTVKKPTVRAAEKFLKKYPESVYAPIVLRMRDSLLLFSLDYDDAPGLLEFYKNHPDTPFKDLVTGRIMEHNTSRIAHEEAMQIAGKCLDAIGWKKDNVEHVLALDEGLSLRMLSPDGELELTRDILVYSLSDSPGAPALVKTLDIVTPFGLRNYLNFGYLNGSAEYVEVLYLPEEDILNQVMFYGSPLKPAEGESFRIEGQSPEMMEGLTLTPETAWLVAGLKENSSLKQISKADLLTDSSIKWWLEKNSKAQTSASRLTFGQLDPEASIIDAYKKAPKEKGKGCSVAVFDIRGYTVIVAASKATGDYTLVWCEPACRDKRGAKYLSSIYFENDGTTLNLFYYKGKSILKIKISLPSQTIRRSS